MQKREQLELELKNFKVITQLTTLGKHTHSCGHEVGEESADDEVIKYIPMPMMIPDNILLAESTKVDCL